MSYAGFYINLDTRTDRRAEMEAELARHNLGGVYRRFSAVTGNDLGFSNPHLTAGEMGCFSSHYKLLRDVIDLNQSLHIIEDDTLIAAVMAPTLRHFIDQGLCGDYDIIYTDVFIPLQNDAYKAYKNRYDRAVTRDGTGAIIKADFSIFDLKGVLFGSTSSYLVNKHAIGKLYNLYEREISSEPLKSIDLFIRRMCNEGALKVGCLFPFLTSVRLDHIVETDIVRPYHQLSALATHIARYSFYVDADFDKCRDYLRKFLPVPPADDKHTQILHHLLAFSLTDHYRSF